jgi:prophage regulatory protein
MRDAMPPADALLLTVRQVATLTQLGVRTIWRYVAVGYFPPPISIGPKAKRWTRQAVEAWIAAKASEGAER